MKDLKEVLNHFSYTFFVLSGASFLVALTVFTIVFLHLYTFIEVGIYLDWAISFKFTLVAVVFFIISVLFRILEVFLDRMNWV